MGSTTLAELIPVLQVAVGPVILISGVGLLLLSMTNRFGRIVDRARVLAEALGPDSKAERAVIEAQVQVLTTRARLVRRAILLTTTSVFLAAVLVLVLFLAALLEFEVAWLVSVLFMGCMAALCAGLLPFLQDVNLSLRAFDLELGGRQSD